MRWFAWLRGIDLPPWGRGLPPISLEFFACASCGSLWGGISGKGPSKTFRGERAPRCRHQWRVVSGADFRAQSSARFGVDWAAESAWWKERP